MQWLTAILAFATTMLLFAIVVTTLVETIHRALGSRRIGYNLMLQHFYDRVLKSHLQKNSPELGREDFIKSMSVVRAPVKATDIEDTDYPKLTRWSFKLLSGLPTESFMERLGTSTFSTVMDSKRETENKLLLKDIAQKYEMFGQESSLHFESKARLMSVIVGLIVGWVFYVHPYNLIQTYLKNPEVGEKVALLANEGIEKYNKLMAEAEKLQKDQTQAQEPMSPLTRDELDKLVKELSSNIETAKVEVSQLSQGGAPIGWPETKVKKVEWLEKEMGIDIWYPESHKDAFWLLMGGLLVGLGAPFWAKFIGQLAPAQAVSKNIGKILKPHSPSEKNEVVTEETQKKPASVEENPITSEAFFVAATASKSAKSHFEGSKK